MAGINRLAAMSVSPTSGAARPAVFLDRDGVINHDIGYLWRIDDVVFKEGIFEFCRTAVSRGYRLVVVTNQAGIGRGFFSEDDFHRLTRWMRQRFEDEAAPLTDVYYCPYHAQHGVGVYQRDSFDRKPHPGMLLKAARSHGIALGASLMVGDKESDLEAGYNAGIPQRCLILEDTEAPPFSHFATHTAVSIRALVPLLRDHTGT